MLILLDFKSSKQLAILVAHGGVASINNSDSKALTNTLMNAPTMAGGFNVCFFLSHGSFL